MQSKRVGEAEHASGPGKKGLLAGKLLTGLAIGATAMYAFDPVQGKTRRAKARDRATRAMSGMRSGLDAARRDFDNRLSGWRARNNRPSGASADDFALQARIRSQLGRLVTHAHAVQVSVVQGRVVISGPILAAEESELRAAIAATPGVSEVVSRLEVHATPGNIPALQGLQRNGPRYWGPAQRLAVGSAGGALMLSGLRRGGALGLVASLAGAGLAARAVSNREVTSLLGMSAGQGAIEVQKSITIAASPERVFDLWERYENFPRFMAHVKQVQDLGDGRSHWVVDGPAGSTVEFDAVLTRRDRPRALGWQTQAGATVEHSGQVRLEPTRQGGTRVTVRMAYRPPAGAVGHAVAAILGRDPKRQMNDDLMRMKAFIETGATPSEGSLGVRPTPSPSSPMPPTLHS
jgi:uncharacterized membrane protein/osmotically-inducible protein OsmY